MHFEWKLHLKSLYMWPQAIFSYIVQVAVDYILIILLSRAHLVWGYICVLHKEMEWYFMWQSSRPTASDIVNVGYFFFAGEKFRENVGKTFHVGAIFMILLLFPS